MSFLESILQKNTCYDCAELVILKPSTDYRRCGLLGCRVKDKLLLPDYLPQSCDEYIGPGKNTAGAIRSNQGAIKEQSGG
jgi:hypothetical protein